MQWSLRKKRNSKQMQMMLSLEQDSEEQKQIITSTLESLPHHFDLKEIESLREYSEKEDIHINLGLEICEELLHLGKNHLKTVMLNSVEVCKLWRMIGTI